MRSLVVVADHPVAVHAIRLALRHTAGFRVLATLDGRASVRAKLFELKPEMVLVDEMCQRTNALARLREACEEAPEATVVLLSSGLDTTALDEAFEAGAHVVISRRLHSATLGTLLREVVHGNVVHAPRRQTADGGANLGAGNRTAASRHAHLHALVDQEAPTARTSA